MEVLTEADPSVWRVFGREPLVEDWRRIGCWAYGSAWIAEDMATAREIVRARFLGASKIATQAAMAAGRGDAERYALVSALARLPDVFVEGSGPLAEAAERLIEETASRLVQEGSALRTLTRRERAAFAPRVGLDGFHHAMRETGVERHVAFREVAAEIDETLSDAHGDCPAMWALRMFLAASLCHDSSEAAAMGDRLPAGRSKDAFSAYAAWLSADLALAARRASAFESAWAAAARVSSDALSRTLAGLTSGAMQTQGVLKALGEDPWSLVLALAMTSEPEHASALLELGAQAQTALRSHAISEVAHWSLQANRVETLETRLGITILARGDDREGHREFTVLNGFDVFGLWNLIRRSEGARKALHEATEIAVAAESSKRREAVRKAKASLEAVREAYESVLDSARASYQHRIDAEVAVYESQTDDGASAHKGCFFGFAAGFGVLIVYAILGVVLGTGGAIGRLGPLVMAVAAVPVAAAIMVQVAYALRRSAAANEASRRRSAAAAELDRAREIAEREHGVALGERRKMLEEAEISLNNYEKLVAHHLRKAS